MNLKTETKIHKTEKRAKMQHINVTPYAENAKALLHDTQITLAGKRIEIKRYRKPIMHIKEKTQLSFRAKAPNTLEYKRRNDNKKRARTKVTQLIHQNLPLTTQNKLKPRFYLLTYENQQRGLMKNHELHMKDLSNFMRKLRKRFPLVDIEYMGTKEKTDKGQAHFHILFTGLPYINKEILESLWGQGFVKIKAVKTGYQSIKHVANYVGKYITKDTDDLKRYEKNYFVSLGLKQPKKIYRPYRIMNYLRDAVNEGYKITTYDKDYPLNYGENTVTYEVWEPA